MRKEYLAFAVYLLVAILVLFVSLLVLNVIGLSTCFLSIQDAIALSPLLLVQANPSK
jgi:hypothetical protein